MLVNNIGLTAEKLINFGINQYSNQLIDMNDEIKKNNGVTKIGTRAQLQIIINEEAIIETIALMIERNNQILLQHLKQLGVIQDQ